MDMVITTTTNTNTNAAACQTTKKSVRLLTLQSIKTL
jgi:hypothetical protein